MTLNYDLNINQYFHEHKLKYFHQLIESSLNEKLFPGIEVMLFQKQTILFHQVYGNKQTRPDHEKLAINSIFDIASMTKPIITASLIMLLLEQGKLNLDDNISEFFPSFLEEDKKQITIKHLLTHTSGLPAWHNLYENSHSLEEAKETLLSLPLDYQPDSQVIYSCMGFIILKLIIETVTSKPLDTLANEWILKPLGMNDSHFTPSETLKERIPPTGDCPWRKKMIHGEVHDENCYFFKGLGGNAGLFSTAYDIAVFSNMLLQNETSNRKSILSPASIQLMTQNQVQKKDLLPRGLGYQLKPLDASQCGELFGAHSFGHTGFTGTSFWIDPDSSIGIIILTNRVHLAYHETVKAMRSFRMRAHNILLASLKSH